jgi:hypothetical protein
MSSKQKSCPASRSKALAVKTIFGPPPILPEEDSDAYGELLARVSAHVKPTSVIEEIWVRDVVDLTWEILRWRRIKMSLISRKTPDALSDFLRPFVTAWPGYEEALQDGTSEYSLSNELAQRWEMKDTDVVAWVNGLIAEKYFSFDAVMNSAFVRELPRIESIDRLVTVAENRRNAVLREIERHRATFAQLLRDTVQDVQDAEFETIEPKSIPQIGRVDENAS